MLHYYYDYRLNEEVIISYKFHPKWLIIGAKKIGGCYVAYVFSEIVYFVSSWKIRISRKKRFFAR